MEQILEEKNSLKEKQKNNALNNEEDLREIDEKMGKVQKGYKKAKSCK